MLNRALTWREKLNLQRDMIETVNYLRSSRWLINQLADIDWFLAEKKKKEREKRKHWKRTLEKRKFEICKSMEQLKEAEKNGKKEKLKGQGNERWREKVWKASSNVSIRGRITVIPGSTWSIWISKSSVIKCSFRAAVRFYEWASLVNRPRRRWPERRPRFI